MYGHMTMHCTHIWSYDPACYEATHNLQCVLMEPPQRDTSLAHSIGGPVVQAETTCNYTRAKVRVIIRARVGGWGRARSGLRSKLKDLGSW